MKELYTPYEELINFIDEHGYQCLMHCLELILEDIDRDYSREPLETVRNLKERYENKYE